MYRVGDKEIKIGQIFSETLQVQNPQPFSMLGKGQTRSVLPELGNGDPYDGKDWKFYDS